MKILVSDFDLTLFDNNYLKNIESIKKFVEDGNKFIIATGRNLRDLKKEIDNYNIPCSFYICKDGSAIYDEKQNLIYEKNIDDETSKSIIEYLKKTNNFDKILVDNKYEYTDEICNVNSIIAHPLDFEKAKIILKEILLKYKNIDGYLSRNWINLNDINCNKKTGIDYLVKLNNYDKKNIYTVGDTVNDYKMIKEYNGYTMKCADQNLKEIAIDIVDNLDELIKKIKD